LAGRVGFKRKKNGTGSRLVKFARPLLRIPQLAIHLDRGVNEKGLVLNPQNHLPPILQLAAAGKPAESVLHDLVGKEIKVAPQDILSLELMLFDLQPAALGGAAGEFIFAPRLDNLASCHAATLALLEAPPGDAATRVLAFYDHEEVGSETAQGGGSPFLKDALERLAQNAVRPREALMRGLAHSLFVSADMAHAVHPNYADLHEARHLPRINGGPVIKSHAAQRYATDGPSATRFEALCARARVPVQKFVMRSDLACGSTIGPITAANLGIRTVDVGNPMLSMHSVREMSGAWDHAALIRVFREFFQP
ncbi:MAG: M18 family aminopeptidase, partial [Nitrospinaceae bacterium]